jgi:putative ABC transport system permease protein
VRLAVTLTGVVFAVVLVAIQAGLFIGFRTCISNLIDKLACRPLGARVERA